MLPQHRGALFVGNIVSALQSAYDLLRMADSDKIMSGKIWRKAWEVQEDLKAWETKQPALQGIANLWEKRWAEFHHPILGFAYAINPEYHSVKPWSDESVAKDVSTILKRFFPDPGERGAVLVCLEEYYTQDNAFSTTDASGDKREVWDDSYLKGTAPWAWWSRGIDPAALSPPFSCEAARIKAETLKKLRQLCQRGLKIGIASSCNERIFSHWDHILGKRRTRTGVKRQLDVVNVYSNERVLKEVKSQHFQDCDSSESVSSEESQSESN